MVGLLNIIHKACSGKIQFGSSEYNMGVDYQPKGDTLHDKKQTWNTLWNKSICVTVKNDSTEGRDIQNKLKQIKALCLNVSKYSLSNQKKILGFLYKGQDSFWDVLRTKIRYEFGYINNFIDAKDNPPDLTGEFYDWIEGKRSCFQDRIQEKAFARDNEFTHYGQPSALTLVGVGVVWVLVIGCSLAIMIMTSSALITLGFSVAGLILAAFLTYWVTKTQPMETPITQSNQRNTVFFSEKASIDDSQSVMHQKSTPNLN